MLILLAPLVYALAYEAVQFVRSNVTLQSIKWFLIGMVSCAVIYVVLLNIDSKAIKFIEVFRHELAHAAVRSYLAECPRCFL